MHGQVDQRAPGGGRECAALPPHLPTAHCSCIGLTCNVGLRVAPPPLWDGEASALTPPPRLVQGFVLTSHRDDRAPSVRGGDAANSFLCPAACSLWGMAPRPR